MLFTVLLRQLFNYITVSFLCQAFFKSFLNFLFSCSPSASFTPTCSHSVSASASLYFFLLNLFKLLSLHPLVECFIIISFISGVVNSNLLQFFHHNLSIYNKTKKRSFKSSSFINTILIMCYLIDRDYDC